MLDQSRKQEIEKATFKNLDVCWVNLLTSFALQFSLEISHTLNLKGSLISQEETCLGFFLRVNVDKDCLDFFMSGSSPTS